MSAPLLDVRNLSVTLPFPSGPARVVRDLSFSLQAGERLGIVGESGSGKSMTALALIGLLPAIARAEGEIRFEGRDLVSLPEPERAGLRGARIAMVFQEPMTSLNPVHRIGDQVAEPLLIHGRADRATARAEALRLLDRVGIPRARDRLDAYPHELSGGQRQRVMIAMALACRPALLVADEPTSALDVTVQAGLIALLKELSVELGMALVIISHDLAVIGAIAERSLVMYGGAAMEEGASRAMFRAAIHPYTRGLVGASPGRHAVRGARLAAIPGTVPSPDRLPPGCPFHGRCARGTDLCRDMPPPFVGGPASRAACHHPERAP
ncbi:ABC transporter ATP-binding protein [Prosthecomicrobium hirschii]|uniref:ABC transporter ATP-binding protein n=1 Tax=Prosthecodimorpha hirschii TaxID=665126 RepID=UPI00221E91F1|nr:ABC transporter ATP-binding protein [Prosthecomicrobium hirschii]MCW1842869.1 ABC transporter ATP-binding protein [Prosthecomicrobium hirschii]